MNVGSLLCHPRANTRSLSATGLIAILAIGLDLLSANAQPDGANAVPNAPAAAMPIATPPPTQSQFDATFNAAITSDYNYRGYTLSNHQPSASTNFQASYGIFFAGQNSSSVDIPHLGQFESVTAAGIRPVFGPLTIEAGAEYFSYPGSQIDVDYLEYYVSPTYTIASKLALGLNVLYAPITVALVHGNFTRRQRPNIRSILASHYQPSLDAKALAPPWLRRLRLRSNYLTIPIGTRVSVTHTG
jgi:hypothetical protein